MLLIKLTFVSEYAIHYMHDADIDLMIFALRNYNEIFLKFALRQSIFGLSFLCKDIMIEEFLGILKYYINIYLISTHLELEQKQSWS